MASGSKGRKKAICDQKESGTCQIPKRWERKETTVEGSPKKQIKGQLRPHGSRRCPNQTPPYRTPGETKKGRMMFPLRGPRTHVQGMPQKDQQTTPLHQSPNGGDPTDGHYINQGGHDPNRNR